MTAETLETKSWWARNWKWFVPAGCLGLMAIGAALVALVVSLVFGALKSSDVYKQAFEKASKNRTVIAEMGEPITSGWLVGGSISVSGPTGNADIEIPISGPKKSGAIYAVAQKSGGRWTFSRLEVSVQGRSDRINLMPSSE